MVAAEKAVAEEKAEQEALVSERQYLKMAAEAKAKAKERKTNAMNARKEEASAQTAIDEKTAVVKGAKVSRVPRVLLLCFSPFSLAFAHRRR